MFLYMSISIIYNTLLDFLTIASLVAIKQICELTLVQSPKSKKHVPLTLFVFI